MLSSQLTRVTCSVTDDPAAGRPLKPVLEQKECTASFGGADNVFARGPETLCPLRCYGSRPSSAPHCFISRICLRKALGVIPVRSRKDVAKLAALRKPIRSRSEERRVGKECRSRRWT